MGRSQTAAFVVYLMGTALVTWGQDSSPATILMDGKLLAKNKVRVENQDPALKPALSRLVSDANKALSVGPYSVTNKRIFPPGGDEHDYASFGRYWWPDPNTPDGLPYIRRDGETNPDSQSPDKSDRPRLELLGTQTETLGLAYYYTGEKKYADKAAELLRVWFLDPQTRMNPNLNFAQGRPGHRDGSKSGVLDGRMMTRALEGSLLIADSNSLSEAERKGLVDWTAEYHDWLMNGKLAVQEAASQNNHGSFFDAQAIYFALYSGNKQSAAKIANQIVEKRILSQIKPDGSMPEELERTRPMFYSMYNLHAMLLLARLAEQVDVDIWNGGDARLRTGLDYLAPFADPNKAWPTSTIEEGDRIKMFAILLMADRGYPAGNYLENLQHLPLSKRETRRENLAFPLMR